MTQTGYEYITLSELVSKSGVIVVAEKLNPLYTEKEILIHDDREKYPPYKSTVYHYRVLKELFPKTGTYNGREVNIQEYEHTRMLALHKKYYLNDMGVSPVLERYETKAPYDADKLILFLNEVGAELEFAAIGSYEELNQESQIKGLIKKNKKSKQ